MKITELSFNHLFDGIRYKAKEPNDKPVTTYNYPYIFDSESSNYSHYCTDCGQVFTAIFGHHGSGLTYAWDGYSYTCPKCGKKIYTSRPDSSNYKSNMGKAFYKDEYIPLSVTMTVNEFKEKIQLIVNADCITFDKDPDIVFKNKVKEIITFDVKHQKTYFQQFTKTVDKVLYYYSCHKTVIGKPVERVPRTEIQNPYDTTLQEYSVLKFINRDSQANQLMRNPLTGFLKTIRETLINKIRQVKNYKTSAFSIRPTKEFGYMLEPIKNMAWRLAVTDGPNLEEFYKDNNITFGENSTTIESDTLPTVTKENMEQIINICAKGKSYPQAVLKTFELPDNKSERSIIKNSSILIIAIIKTLSKVNLNDKVRKLLEMQISQKWSSYFKNKNLTSYQRFKHNPINSEGLHFIAEAYKKTSEKITAELITQLETNTLNDTGTQYFKLTEEEKEKVWEKATSAKALHDICSELNWKHNNPDYNLDIPEHIKNRLMMQKEQLSFYLPETYYNLRNAGKELNNCVGGAYPENVKNGKCCIVLVSDDKGKLKVCIELRQQNIVQAKMFGNKPVCYDPLLNQTVIDWAKEKKLKIETEDIKTKTKKKTRIRKVV